MSPGQTISIESLGTPEGEAVELDKVLMVSEGEKTVIGKPFVDGARVLATSLGGGKGKKIIIFKYKHKVRYRRKTGHRQLFTKLAINEIQLKGSEAKEEVISSGT